MNIWNWFVIGTICGAGIVAVIISIMEMAMPLYKRWLYRRHVLRCVRHGILTTNQARWMLDRHQRDHPDA